MSPRSTIRMQSSRLNTRNTAAFTRRALSARTILAGTIAAAALIASPSEAAQINWLGGDAGGATDFNLGLNWAGGNLPTQYAPAPTGAATDTAVFDGAQAGLVNKTPTLTSSYWLYNLIFEDSGWTLNTGSNALSVSWRPTQAVGGGHSLQSNATSGVNTINGNLKFGASDTNFYSDIYVAAGGTLRLNTAISIVADKTSGGNTSGGIDITGPGTLELNTTGTLIGGLRIKGGTVKLVSETAGGITGDGAGGLGTANNVTLRIEGGKLDVNGARSTLAPGTLLLSAAGELTNSSATLETIVTKAASSQTLAGLISGNLNLSLGANASETTRITNHNSYTGTTTINSSSGGGGTHTVVVTQDVMPNANGPLGNASSAIILGSTGNTTTHAALLTDGAIEIGRDITLGSSTNATGLKTIGAASTQTGDSTFSGTITVGTGLQSHLTVTAPANVTVGITGNVVEHSATGNGGLTKTGLGTARLTGSNTYAGGTAVNAGVLLANNTAGSATGTGAVTVGASGTLGGTGRIAPTGSNGISISGTLAPGAGIGLLEIDLGGTTGTTSMLSGSGFKFELGVAGAGIATPGTSDSLRLTGASAADFVFNSNAIDFLGTGAQGWYKLFDTDLASGSTWNGLTFSGQEITDGLLGTNLGPGLTGTLVIGNGTLGDADDIYLHVVPEPSTGIALLGGLGMLLGSLRRRQRAI